MNADQRREYNQRYYARNRERLCEARRARYADHQEQERDKGKRYRAKNRERECSRVRDWNKENRAKANAQTHRYRARQRAAQIGDPVALQERIDEIYTESCVWCGTVDNIHVDHIWPLSKGGAHAVFNLQALCGTCNAKKGDRILLQLPETCLGSRSLSGDASRAAAPALAG
jgi:5-methylcytosine-specific restriction endonuclease McrA